MSTDNDQPTGPGASDASDNAPNPFGTALPPTRSHLGRRGGGRRPRPAPPEPVDAPIDAPLDDPVTAGEIVDDVVKLRDELVGAAAGADPDGVLPPVPKPSKATLRAITAAAAPAVPASQQWDLPDYDALNAGGTGPDPAAESGAVPAEVAAAVGTEAPARRPVLLLRRRLRSYAGAGPRGHGVLVGVVAVGVVAGGVALLVGLAVHSGMHIGPFGDPAPAAVDSHTPPPAWATADCVAGHDGKTTIGAGLGDYDSAAGAVQGFEHAYYVQRSAAVARQFLAEDASIRSDLQAGIDATPPGTRYCVHLTPEMLGTYRLDLYEQHPGDPAPRKWAQNVSATHDGGQWRITSIAKR